MPIDFNAVETLADLDTVFAESHHRPVVLFKHSSSCGISAHVMEMIGSVETDINLIVVQQSRDVSNAIESRTGHRHQSPQAFVIRDGKAIYQASHYGIDPAAINSHLGA